MLNKTVVPSDGIVIYLALSYVVDMEEVGVGSPTSIGVVCQVTTAPTSWKRKTYSRGKRGKFQVLIDMSMLLESKSPVSPHRSDADALVACYRNRETPASGIFHSREKIDSIFRRHGPTKVAQVGSGL
jgi:hypothetical protein